MVVKPAVFLALCKNDGGGYPQITVDVYRINLASRCPFSNQLGNPPIIVQPAAANIGPHILHKRAGRPEYGIKFDSRPVES